MNVQEALKLTAKQYGISVAELRRNMQSAINEAWTKPDKTAAERKRQAEVPCRGSIPTPEEFLLYCDRRLWEEGK